MKMEFVLDTNIYRNLVRGLDAGQLQQLIAHIKKQLEEQDIKLFFPINSAMELISHFNDDIENERKECRNSLKLLVELSTSYSSTHIHVDFAPPLNAILERYFHGQENVHAQIYSQVITVAQMLVGNILADPVDVMNGYVNTIKKQIIFEKQEIRNNYQEYLKSINNGDADWSYFKDKKQLRKDYFTKLRIGKLSFLVAQSFVDRAYNIVGMPINKDEDYYNKVIRFMQDFCPALVMNELLLENIGHGVDAIQDVADERWNTIIDISLIFGALFNPNNVDRRLVTEEKNIHNSFQSCNFKNKIINLDELKILLNI